MNAYELEQYCAHHPNCDHNCAQCDAFAQYQSNSHGYNDRDDDDDYGDDE